ncbi:MAG: acyl-CoA thioesterase YciA [Gammaproteobacteria bacterium]|nr:MAG: acyl-CoA thioesterase YciA [Gammaproteobacteria bacterium]TND05498.1 MAG: acyl-CoA thioesterase YciA [Gammaproteobacteria bacterium]
MSEELPGEIPQPVLRVIPMPSDTNAAGNIFGGWLMSQADLAGSVVAMQRASGRVVTVAVNTFQFYKPVLVGDIVTIYGSVTHVGTTSVTVEITIFASHVSPTDRSNKVADATLTYVAIDENFNKRTIPPER